jgi:phosphatidylinositol 4-kinase B
VRALKAVTHKLFGRETDEFRAAQINFARSLAAHSAACYVLQVKDRHNGNILVSTTTGEVAHIDFGFLLGASPGNVGFETAPFKLTAEYVEVRGGGGGC